VRGLLEMDARIHALERPVQDLTVRLAARQQRVRHLEERLAKDSHNSSQPPSSDALSKPKPKSLRSPSERPTGGQPGHSGHTLRMVEQPDRMVSHPVKRCAGCGRSLTGQAPDRVERRQVFDLPEPKLEVTEHQAEVKTCACGCLNRAVFPPEVTAPVEYGLRVKSVAVYLKEYQLLPFDRLAEIMRDLFACDTFSEGTLANFSAACSRRLEPMDAFIRAQASAGVLPDFQGRAVHDFWDSYLKYDCDHAFSNAHLLRELVFLWEEHAQAWAKTMIDHLLAIKTAVDTAPAGRPIRPAGRGPGAVPQGVRTDRPSRLRAESGRGATRPQTPWPPQTKQSPQPARPFPRPPRQHPGVPARLRGALRQQPVGTGSADDEAAAEDLRHVPQLRGAGELLPHPGLRCHRPHERRQRLGCPTARVLRQSVRAGGQHLVIRAHRAESGKAPNTLR